MEGRGARWGPGSWGSSPAIPHTRRLRVNPFPAQCLGFPVTELRAFRQGWASVTDPRPGCWDPAIPLCVVRLSARAAATAPRAGWHQPQTDWLTGLGAGSSRSGGRQVGAFWSPEGLLPTSPSIWPCSGNLWCPWLAGRCPSLCVRPLRVPVCKPLDPKDQSDGVWSPHSSVTSS